jgi:hypothetical protein
MILFFAPNSCSILVLCSPVRARESLWKRAGACGASPGCGGIADERGASKHPPLEVVEANANGNPTSLEGGTLRARRTEQRAGGDWIPGLKDWDVSARVDGSTGWFALVGESIELWVRTSDGRDFGGNVLVASVEQGNVAVRGTGPLDGLQDADFV